MVGSSDDVSKHEWMMMVANENSSELPSRARVSEFAQSSTVDRRVRRQECG